METIDLKTNKEELEFSNKIKEKIQKSPFYKLYKEAYKIFNEFFDSYKKRFLSYKLRKISYKLDQFTRTYKDLLSLS